MNTILLLQNSQIIFVLLIFLFIFRSIRNLLYHLFVWQRRDYRIDRMVVHLLTESGQRWSFGNFSLIKWFALALYILIPSLRDNVLPLLLIFLLESVVIIKEWMRSGIKKPELTPKIIGIILVVCVIFSGFSLLKLPVTVILLVTDKLLAIVVFILLLILKIPFSIYKWILIRKARKKMSQFPHIIRIGITGSFGKSSTKEFLSQLLSEKYNVVKTPKNINTDIGIAKLILKKVTKSTQIVVIEMGAYKKGEIASICSFVKPDIGIVTAINEQHIDLFGSIAKIRATKYELIESLPRSGLALFNEDNDYTRLMAKKTKGIRVITYGTKKGSEALIKNIRETEFGLQFTLQTKEEIIECKTKLLGFHLANNLSAAIIVARYLKVPKVTLELRLKTLKLQKHSLQIVGKAYGAIVIDDTLNANPDGVLAAIKVLEKFPGKKYMVLTPLIELGESGSKVHKELIEHAIKSITLILLTNKSYFKEMLEIAQKYNRPQMVQLVNTKAGVTILKGVLTDGDAVAFLGKESRHILDQIESKII